jgi:hypothetical protein
VALPPAPPLLLCLALPPSPPIDMKAIAVAKVLLLIEYFPFISCGAGKKICLKIAPSHGPHPNHGAITVPPALNDQGVDSVGVAPRRKTQKALRE